MPKATGAFRADGFYHSEYAYRVPYAPGNGQALISSDWQLDNFDTPIYRPDPSPKRSDDYFHTLAIDDDGDGVADVQRRVPLYDLRWIHRRHDATMWVRTFPLSRVHADRELRTLVQAYVDQVAGAGYVRVELGPNLTAVLEDRRYATRIVDMVHLPVADRDAFGVTFDVARVEQLQMQQSARSERVRIVLLRTGETWSSGNQEHPVLMLLGYANLPQDFDQDLPGFVQLLNQVDFSEPPTPYARARVAVPTLVHADGSPVAPQAPAPQPVPAPPVQPAPASRTEEPVVPPSPPTP
ncbi:MAG: hypothetical protein AAGF12_11765 [Myxococcota bacterium]